MNRSMTARFATTWMRAATEFASTGLAEPHVFRQPHNSKDGGLGIAVGAIDEADPMAAVSLNGQLGLISGKCAGMPGIFGTSAVTISGDSSGGGFHHRFSVSPFGGGSGQLACPGRFYGFPFGRAQAIDLFIDRSDEVRGPRLTHSLRWWHC